MLPNFMTEFPTLLFTERGIVVTKSFLYFSKCVVALEDINISSLSQTRHMALSPLWCTRYM